MWKKENKGLRFGLVFVRAFAGFYRTMRSINNAIDKPLRCLNAKTTDNSTSKLEIREQKSKTTKLIFFLISKRNSLQLVSKERG